MSFEGSYQFLCENGHKSSGDCYSYYDADFADWKCPVCNAGLGWWNLVDVTNGSFCDCDAGQSFGDADDLEDCEYCEAGRIDGWVDVEINQPAKTERCNLGHEHVIEPATFKIPEGRGHIYKPGDRG